MGFKMRPLLASSLLFVLLPLAVLAAPTVRRHGGHHEEATHEHKHGLAIKAHGTLLTLAFTFLYPTGVFLIRGGFQRGFLLHWGTQAGATMTALVGMMIMIIKSWSRLVTGKASVHHYIGTGLFLAVCLQVLLGYYHHVLFVKVRRRTAISYAHIVLGWVIVCGGWVNTFLGFRMGGISTPLVAVWFLWLLLASVLMVQAPKVAELLKQPREDAAGKYDAVQQDEPAERKTSREHNSVPMDSFAIGE